MRKTIGLALIFFLTVSTWAANPTYLLSLLDKVKTTQRETSGMIEYAPDFILTYNYDDFRIFLRRIYAFTNEEVIVFEILLENKTGSTIFYDPNTITLSRHGMFYPVALVDGTGQIPAFSITRNYLLIVSDMTGKPVNMNLDAAWSVVLRPMKTQKIKWKNTGQHSAKLLEKVDKIVKRQVKMENAD